MNNYVENEGLKQLKNKANNLPITPGVYIMKNKRGEIIYIGKAKALKNRVTQYFGSGNNHTEKVKKMVSNVADFDYILCNSEFEALMLESSLINRLKPKYNILLKEGKGYYYIKITEEKWRRFKVCTQKDGQGDFIGPYYSGYVVKNTVEQLNEIFRLPDCNRSFDRYSKPCLNYHLGRCSAPCANKIDIKDYNADISLAIDFLKHKKTDSLIMELTADMEKASDEEKFEKAAALRDRIKAIKNLAAKQNVIMSPYKRQNVIASVVSDQQAVIVVLVFKEGMLCDKQEYCIEGYENKAELYGDFLLRYYENNEIMPYIFVDEMPLFSDEIAQYLSNKAGRKITLRVPKRGNLLTLMETCKNNAIEGYAKMEQGGFRQMKNLENLQALLNLSAIPERIESYDISHTAGSNTIGGMVVYIKGERQPSLYRTFNIKTVYGVDDPACLCEVINRRLNEYEKGSDASFSALPDLILLDGGITQLNAVLPVIKAHNLSIPTYGMVKNNRHKTNGLLGETGSIDIKQTTPIFDFITGIQDEVHRFSIRLHRNKRDKIK